MARKKGDQVVDQVQGWEAHFKRDPELKEAILKLEAREVNLQAGASTGGSRRGAALHESSWWTKPSWMMIFEVALG